MALTRCYKTRVFLNIILLRLMITNYAPIEHI